VDSGGDHIRNFQVTYSSSGIVREIKTKVANGGSEMLGKWIALARRPLENQGRERERLEKVLNGSSGNCFVK
jgi:hypothetical protein